MKRVVAAIAVLALLVVAGGFVTRPAKLLATTEVLTLEASPQSYLTQQEELVRTAFGVVDGAEKRVLWAGDEGARTEYSVVYLHGFSATRQEIAPLPELLARNLGANLFETRLAGHGLERERLANVSAEEWLRDGSEALSIGRALGDKLILVGTSTGATIALALARHPLFASIDSIVLISPNFGPATEGAEISTGPYGPQLARLIAGEYREWQPANEQQGIYWTTRYPTASIIEMMRLVNLAVDLTSEARVPSALLVYSPQDDVVSVDKLLAGFELMPAQRKEILRIDNPNSLSPHVLTGDILAPGTATGLATQISAFLRP